MPVEELSSVRGESRQQSLAIDDTTARDAPRSSCSEWKVLDSCAYIMNALLHNSFTMRDMKAARSSKVLTFSMAAVRERERGGGGGGILTKLLATARCTSRQNRGAFIMCVHNHYYYAYLSWNMSVSRSLLGCQDNQFRGSGLHLDCLVHGAFFRL